MSDDLKYTEFFKAMKGQSAKKIRDLAASEGIELSPGLSDRDLLVLELFEKRTAKKASVGTPTASPPPSATEESAVGEPAPEAVDNELQDQIRAQAAEPMVRVRCRTQRTKWRCHHQFTMAPQFLPAGKFSEDEWKRIEADIGLEVKWPTRQ